MKRTLGIVAMLAALPCPALAATAATDGGAEPSGEMRSARAAQAASVPAQLTTTQRDGYRAVFAAIREQRWQDAQIGLDGMPPGPLHAVARAELYTAKGSPRVELQPLTDLINQAPELPQAEALRRIATARGATGLPPLPSAQRLIWQDGAPRRVRTKATASDMVAADLAQRMQPFVKADDGVSAEALLVSTGGLSAEATTEWRARVAWMYFLRGDDAKTRELGDLAAGGIGDWAVQGRWMASLAAWRQRDCAAAEAGFEGVAARAGDVDLRAAGLYWASRADMVCARPDRIEGRLKAAAQFGESFYGQLARQALGLHDGADHAQKAARAADWATLDKRPNVRVAAALAEIGESDLADDVIRQQAKIGNPAEFGSLVRLAETLDLPATTIFLAHNTPAGVTTMAEARYPAPNWTPDSGWRVDKALVYAHALEESRFRSKVTSQAGAYGLMQIMPAAATDFGRERGRSIDKAALSRPSTNMDIGQRHLERLRDMGLTGGLLPKVIAAYNAGPKPVGEWNAIVHDGGDPLLYIESIPYWETRGYVTTVLRNYWMYEARAGKAAPASRNALAQGLWPRFPGLAGATAVRMTPALPGGNGPTMLAAIPRTPAVRMRAPMTMTMAARAAAPAVQVAAAVQGAAARLPALTLAPVAKGAPVTTVPPMMAQAAPVATKAVPASSASRVASMVKALPGAMAAAAGALVDTDLLRQAAAAMAMQPQAIVGAVSAIGQGDDRLMPIDDSLTFRPVNIAVLTVSDTRGPADDRSGDTLVARLAAAGHVLADRAIERDDADTIVARLRGWIADRQIDAIITTGGTGVTGRDVTPEAVERVADKMIPGFGELFRWLSYAKIGTSTVQSRACACVAGGTYIFALPGSTGAVKDGWDGILQDQLDSRHRPCNFVELMPRLTER